MLQCDVDSPQTGPQAAGYRVCGCRNSATETVIGRLLRSLDSRHVALFVTLSLAVVYQLLDVLILIAHGFELHAGLIGVPVGHAAVGTEGTGVVYRVVRGQHVNGTPRGEAVSLQLVQRIRALLAVLHALGALQLIGQLLDLGLQLLLLTAHVGCGTESPYIVGHAVGCGIAILHLRQPLLCVVHVVLEQAILVLHGLCFRLVLLGGIDLGGQCLDLSLQILARIGRLEHSIAAARAKGRDPDTG